MSPITTPLLLALCVLIRDEHSPLSPTRLESKRSPVAYVTTSRIRSYHHELHAFLF